MESTRIELSILQDFFRIFGLTIVCALASCDDDESTKKEEVFVADFTVVYGEGADNYFTAIFTDTSTGGEAVEWSWDFGVDGVEDDVSTEQNPSYEYPQEGGSYTVTLTVKNDHGIESTFTSDIIIEPIHFSTLEHLTDTVYWYYRMIAHDQLYGRKLTLALMIRSDIASYGDPSTAKRRIVCDQMRMEADNGLVEAFWPKGYELIDGLSMVINDAGVDIEGASEAEVNHYMAESRFLRALMHYHFVRLFGKIPLTLTAPLGEEEGFSVVDASIDEVYESIITDLEYAKLWLPDNVADRIRPSKGAASGLLSSVYLTRGDWQNAYSEAKSVIDNSGRYGLVLERDFADLFGTISSSSEVLFEVENTAGDWFSNPSELGGSIAVVDQLTALTGPRGDERFAYVNVDSEGWSALVPSAAVHSTWPNDYRKAVSLDTAITYTNFGDTYEDYHFENWGAITQNVPRAHIAKYFRATGQTGGMAGENLRDTDTNYGCMRYAEVLLIAAEAAYELGNVSEALLFVNQLRERARAADGTALEVPKDLTSLTLDDILEERRLELAFEFKRWYDIVRRQMMPEAFGEDGLETVSWTADDYLFPKDQQTVNQYAGVEQNPGY